jgi:hypothetical protein
MKSWASKKPTNRALNEGRSTTLADTRFPDMHRTCSGQESDMGDKGPTRRSGPLRKSLALFAILVAGTGFEPVTFRL